MPKLKFKWENLPISLQTVAMQATGCATLNDLRSAWGVRPGERFVGAHRDVLTTTWLRSDDASRRSVVGTLRLNKLGDYSEQTHSKNGELNYLRSCHNAKRFRQIILGELIGLGEIAAGTAIQDTSEDVTIRRAWRLVSTTGDRSDFVPYPHQREAWTALDAGAPITGGLLVLPTGAGKTVTAVVWILRNVLSGPKPRPVLWLAHRSELLDQAALTFARQASFATGRQTLGIRCISGAHATQAHTMLQPADVVCATVASLQREPQIVAEYFRRHPDAFVVIDEAHHAAARTYQELIAAARKSRSVQILGLTATPTRTDEGELGLLHKAFPQGVLYSVESARLIAEGILARPICETVATGINFEADFSPAELGYLARFGDLSPKTLNRVAAHTARNALIANRYEQFRTSYGQTLVFAASVAHCYTLATELRTRGVRAGYVAYVRDDGRTNDEVLDDFKQGRIEVLLTVTKLTEGFDLPSVATVFLARPTGSRILLSQMVGRGMRGAKVKNGKPDVRVVSFDDHWDRFSDWLDPVEFLDAPTAERPDREPVQKDMVDVPWAVYLEIARMVRQDPGQVGGVENRPVGWFDLSLLPLQSGGLRTVIVFQHQRDGYESFLRDALAGNVDEKPAVLLDWYFSAVAAQPSSGALEVVLRYANELGIAPPFFRFDVMDQLGPEAVARQIAGLTITASVDEIHRLYDSDPMVAALFPDRRIYAEAVFDALLDPRFGTEHFTEHTTVDLAENLPDLPEGDFDLPAMATLVSRRMGLGGVPAGIRWADRRMRSYWAIYYSNPIEILVNPVLKTSAIRSETMQFLIYHELLHRHLGADEGHSPIFRERERQFPGWFDAQAELDTLQERFRLGPARTKR